MIFEGTDCTDIDDISLSIAVKCDSLWVLVNNKINARCNDKWVAQGLLEGTIRTVCDGSCKPKLNDKVIAAAWTIEETKSTRNITVTIPNSSITSDTCR